jgi:hypothetical protein
MAGVFITGSCDGLGRTAAQLVIARVPPGAARFCTLATSAARRKICQPCPEGNSRQSSSAIASPKRAAQPIRSTGLVPSVTQALNRE